MPPTKKSPHPAARLLFGARESGVFAILDGASAPEGELLYRLESAGDDEEWTCLYRGELDRDLAEVAPYLLRLREDSKLTSWILHEGWGHHWGIFVLTGARTTLETLRRHFRHFLRVKDPDGKILYFRYYDPRVLRLYLPTCNRREINYLYGPVEHYITEDAESPKHAVVMSHDDVRIEAHREDLQAPEIRAWNQ